MILLKLGIILLITCIFFKKKFSVYWGFLLILLVMGFQTAQTDYIAYKANFNLIKSLVKYGLDGNLLLYSTFRDIGWTWINILFSFSTFPVMVFCLACVQYYILCQFIKTFVSPRVQYLAPILFYFTFSFMLMQMTAMRQGFAIELCLAAVLCLHKNRNIEAIILCLLAYSIHGTALLGIVFVVLYAINQRWNLMSVGKKQASDWLYPTLFTGLYLCLYLVKDAFVGNISSILFSLYAGEYSNYLSQFNFVEISLLYVVYNGVIVFLSLLYFKYAPSRIRVFIIASVISNFAEMLFFGLGDLPRIFMYFSIYGIVVLPNIANFIKQKFNNTLYYVFIAFCISYALKSFLPHVSAEGYFSTFNFVF